MPSMHRATVPVLVRGLKILTTLLEKGEAHAKATDRDPAELTGARDWPRPSPSWKASIRPPSTAPTPAR
jgi:hypothetical protein